MNPRTEIKLRQLAIIFVSWFAVGIMISLYDHLVLFTGHSEGPATGYSLWLNTGLNLLSATIGALFGGGFMVFHINERYADKPYRYTVLAVSIGFLIIVLLVILVTGMISIPIKTGKPLSDPRSIDAFKLFLMDRTRAKNVLIWSVVVSLTQLFLQISSKFGHGALANIIRGKYNTPVEENKIFMFLDLDASTSIAERLGAEKYHALLKDFFADITNPILDSRGEIYQYVGDEVVIAWNYETGIENNHCVRCFFDIRYHIEKNKDKYMKRYGLIPQFKGGLHCGKVVAGEIGIVKREITYSGDVLNTTSRILSLCKKVGADIVTSASLLSELCLENSYNTLQLGTLKLRGKEQEISLSAVRRLGVEC
jgi:adenylate cyclase